MEEDTDSIGKRIDEIRLAKGMTMRAVSQRSGLAESYLWRIVRGRIDNLTLETVRKIAFKGLDIPISALFDDEKVVIKINNKRPTWCRANNIVYKIAEAVHKLPKEAQELVLVQIESFEKFFAKPKKEQVSYERQAE